MLGYLRPWRDLGIVTESLASCMQTNESRTQIPTTFFFSSHTPGYYPPAPIISGTGTR